MTDSGPIVVNFTEGFHQGDDRDLILSVYEPGTTQAQITAGTASLVADTSGMNFEFAIKERDDDTVQLVSIENGTYLAVADPAAGKIRVKLRNTHTAALAGRYRWACRRTDAGYRSVGGKGDIVFHPAATGAD